MKEFVYSDYSVDVEVDIENSPVFLIELTGQQLHERRMRLSKELAEQIKRHCDYVESATVRVAKHPVCSFCQRDWETMREEDGPDEDMPLGIPVCCGDAQEEWLAAQEPQASTA